MGKNRNILKMLSVLIAMVIVIPIVASCGKGTVSPAASNIALQVINAGPDVLPINIYINFVSQKSTALSYPNGTGYFTPLSIDTPIQIRTAGTSGATYINADSILKPNVRYTAIVTGLLVDKSLTLIFTADTSAIPTIGKGKVRFVNASPRSSGLDIYANGTLAFSNRAFKAVTPYIQLPAGTYDFQFFATGTTTNVIYDLPNTIVQDGRLYTMYSYGLIGRTDTSAFAATVLTNR